MIGDAACVSFAAEGGSFTSSAIKHICVVLRDKKDCKTGDSK